MLCGGSEAAIIPIGAIPVILIMNVILFYNILQNVRSFLKLKCRFGGFYGMRGSVTKE